jgi:putative flippase GtrA
MNTAEIKQYIYSFSSKYKFLSFATIGAFLTLFILGMITFFIKYLNTPLKLTYIVFNLLGILISFYLNSKITFKNTVNLSNTIKYYTIYLSSMLIGTFLLNILENNLNFEKWIYPFMVLPITLSFNYIMSLKFLTTKDLKTINR